MFQTLFLWSMACLCVKSSFFIKGFKEYRNGVLDKEYYLENQEATSLEVKVKESQVPIYRVDLVGESSSIKLTALMKSDSQYLTGIGCENGRRSPLQEEESCILNERSFEYFDRNDMFEIEVVLEKRGSDSEDETGSPLQKRLSKLKKHAVLVAKRSQPGNARQGVSI